MHFFRFRPPRETNPLSRLRQSPEDKPRSCPQLSPDFSCPRLAVFATARLRNAQEFPPAPASRLPPHIPPTKISPDLRIRLQTESPSAPKLSSEIFSFFRAPLPCRPSSDKRAPARTAPMRGTARVSAHFQTPESPCRIAGVANSGNLQNRTHPAL